MEVSVKAHWPGPHKRAKERYLAFQGIKKHLWPFVVGSSHVEEVVVDKSMVSLSFHPELDRRSAGRRGRFTAEPMLLAANSVSLRPSPATIPFATCTHA